MLHEGVRGHDEVRGQVGPDHGAPDGRQVQAAQLLGQRLGQEVILIPRWGELIMRTRQPNHRHDLLDILTIALVASVCGAETCVDFAEFAEDREPLLREFLRLENGLPSHDTFSRVFRLLDPAAFGRAFSAFLDDLGEAGAGVLAIDGKTLRRSFDRAAGRSALHVVTAFGTEARVAIGQRAVAAGENEITAARALLETLTLEGMLVTGDALHCQAETAALIAARGGDQLVDVSVAEQRHLAARQRGSLHRSQHRAAHLGRRHLHLRPRGCRPRVEDHEFRRRPLVVDRHRHHGRLW